jgi:hypothetical protein
MEPISNLFIGPKASQIQELFAPAPGSIRGMRQKSVFAPASPCGDGTRSAVKGGVRSNERSKSNIAVNRAYSTVALRL